LLNGQDICRSDAADVFRYIFDDYRQPLSLLNDLTVRTTITALTASSETSGNKDEDFIEEEQVEEDEAP
jgi:hypothetical protein